MSIFDFGVDLWIELIISNELSNQDILNLTTTCKFFSQFLKNEKLLQFLEDRKICFGAYINENEDKDEISSIAWSADNRTIASGEITGKILIWNTKTGKIKKTLQSHKSSMYCLAFHPLKANLLAAASRNAFFCLWDTDKSEIKVSFERCTTSLAFEPQFVAASNLGSKTVRVWSVETGKSKTELSGMNSFVCSVMFSNDAKFLAASGHSQISIWNFETFELFHNIESKGISFFGEKVLFQFFDNQTLVFFSEEDTSVHIYDFKSGKEKKEMNFEANYRRHCKVVLHPNQNILALGGECGFEVWDTQSKKLLEKKQEWTVDLSFCPNGKALAVVFVPERIRDSAVEVSEVKKYM